MVRPRPTASVRATGVSLHWICDRLTQRQLRPLRDFTVRHLDLVNYRVEHPGTVAILG